MCPVQFLQPVEKSFGAVWELKLVILPPVRFSFFLFFSFPFFLSFFFFFCFCLINGIQKTDILKSGLVRNHSLDGTVEIRFTMPLPALMVWRKTTCFFLNFRHFSNVLKGYDILIQTPWSTLSIKSRYKSEWRRASVNSDQKLFLTANCRKFQQLSYLKFHE